MQDDPHIEHEDLLNDEVAQQLSNLQTPAAGSPQPGQQIAPDPNAPDPVAIKPEPSSSIGGAQSFVPPKPTEDNTDTPSGQVAPAFIIGGDVPVAGDPAAATQQDAQEPELRAEENVVQPDGAAAQDTGVATQPDEPAEEPEPEEAPEEVTEAPEDTPTEEAADEEPAGDPALEDIKNKALQELSPLVDDLDLEPAKRYDVLIEMIQASDDKSLVEKAFEAAHQIEDDHLRAQALLEIVNEIDYLNKSDK